MNLAYRRFRVVPSLFKTRAVSTRWFTQSLSQSDVGKLYCFEESTCQTLFKYGGLSKLHKRLSDAFIETQLITRSQCVEILDYLALYKSSYPDLRFILYGDRGNGKTTILSHLIYEAFKRDNCFVVNVPSPSLWTDNQVRETADSSIPGCAHLIDLPMDACDWLHHFRQQNLHLLDDFALHQSYEWSKREVSEKGSSLSQLIQFALKRPVFACGVVDVILKELRQAVSATTTNPHNQRKILVTIDNCNAFWNLTWVKGNEKKFVFANQLSLVHSFINFIDPKLNQSGAFIVAVDDTPSILEKHQEANKHVTAPQYDRRQEIIHKPASLYTDLDSVNVQEPPFSLNTVDSHFQLIAPTLQKHLQLFVPIYVTRFTDAEARVCLNYYERMGLLQNPLARSELGKQEILATCSNNPHQMTVLCTSH